MRKNHKAQLAVEAMESMVLMSAVNPIIRIASSAPPAQAASTDSGVGSHWEAVSGGGVKIAVGPDGTPWVINSDGVIFRRVGSSWQQLRGTARDIDVGGDGKVWIVGTTPAPGGYGIHVWNGRGWDAFWGAGERIAVGPDGTPWVVQTDGSIWRMNWQKGAWDRLPGAARDIDVGADGKAWVIGMTPTTGGYSIHHWDGGGWARVDGGGERIAVGPDGAAWVVNSGGVIFRRSGSSWQQLPGTARDIDMGKDGSAWIIGTNATTGGYGIFTYRKGDPPVTPPRPTPPPPPGPKPPPPSAPDVGKFLRLYQESFGERLSRAQAEGLERLLRLLVNDRSVEHRSWAAYMLATVKHETANTWQPIEEYGKGRGRDYGRPDPVTGKAYYGRGYVQLTHKSNYERMSRVVGDDLVRRPERALDPEVAYKILSYGMRNGSFTGKKLGDYLSGSKTDYDNARRIVNGMDQSSRIAGYARKLESLLKDAQM